MLFHSPKLFCDYICLPILCKAKRKAFLVVQSNKKGILIALSLIIIKSFLSRRLTQTESFNNIIDPYLMIKIYDHMYLSISYLESSTIFAIFV